MKTDAQLMKMYKATEDQLLFAWENTMMSMQDEYGFDVVTTEFLFSSENDAQVSDLVEASLEAIVREGL